MLQQSIEHGQELMHTRCQGDFFDFPRREEPFVKDWLSGILRGAKLLYYQLLMSTD